MVKKGVIRGFSGSWHSGIASLTVEHEDGTVVDIPCDNAYTVRALDAAFGDVITAGHSVNQESIVGEEIYYSYDEMGLLLGGFTPASEASPELLEHYENLEVTA